MAEIKDDGSYAKIEFKNGWSLAIIYKHMKDDKFIIHYNLGVVNGGRKVTPRTMERYDDVMGMAECGMSYMFFPLLLDQLLLEFRSAMGRMEKTLGLWDAGKIKEAQDANGYYYGALNDKGVRELRSFYKQETEYVRRLEKMKAELAENLEEV